MSVCVGDLLDITGFSVEVVGKCNDEYIDDIWDNKYYQDLPIVYDEIEQEGIIEHSIEIRDVKAPIFVTGDVQSLETAAKKYCDYEVLC